jgi:hypothetical protein
MARANMALAAPGTIIAARLSMISLSLLVERMICGSICDWAALVACKIAKYALLYTICFLAVDCFSSELKAFFCTVKSDNMQGQSLRRSCDADVQNFSAKRSEEKNMTTSPAPAVNALQSVSVIVFPGGVLSENHIRTY